MYRTQAAVAAVAAAAPSRLASSASSRTHSDSSPSCSLCSSCCALHLGPHQHVHAHAHAHTLNPHPLRSSPPLPSSPPHHPPPHSHHSPHSHSRSRSRSPLPSLARDRCSRPCSSCGRARNCRRRLPPSRRAGSGRWRCRGGADGGAGRGLQPVGRFGSRELW